MRAAALALVGLSLLGSPAKADAVFRQPALYPEGPVVIAGALYVAEMTAHKVTRIRDDAAAPGGYRVETFFKRDGCGPTALAEIAGTRRVILCHLEGALAITDADGRLERMIRVSADGVRLDSPNDVSADGAGGAIFSNAGRFHPQAAATGRVMRLAPDLSVSTLVSGLRYANGVAVDRARARVLVSEHLAQRVLSFPLQEPPERADDLALGAPSVLIDRRELARHVALVDPLTGPDGIEIAPSGAALVSIYGGGAVIEIETDGARVATHGAETPYLCATAVWGDRLVLAGAYSNRTAPYEGLIEIRRLP